MAKRHTYKIFYGTDILEIDPKESISTSWEPKDGTFYYQKVLSEFTLTNKNEYQFLKDIEAAGEFCEDIKLLVTYFCGDSKKTEFEGVFNIHDCEFDDFLCTVRISPRADDLYNCVSGNESRNVNILGVTPPNTINADYDNNIFTYTDDGTVGIADVLRVVKGDPAPDASVLLPFIGANEVDLIKIQKMEPDVGIFYDHYFAWAYRRAVPKTGAGGCDPELPGGYVLINSDLTNCYYQRKPSDVDNLENNRTNCNNAGQPPPQGKPADCFFIYENVWTDETFDMSGVADGICMWYCPFDGNHNRARTLEDFIRAFTNKCGVAGVRSDYFQINPENPSLTNYVTGLPTKTHNIFLIQKSDAVFWDSTEPATNGNTTWSSFTEALANIFNVGYTFESDGFIRFEHISYFENLPTVLDLTEAPFSKYIKGKQKYNYKRDVLIFIEKVLQAEYINEDFEPSTIIYEDADGNKLTCVGNQEENIAFGDFFTDLQFYQERPAGINYAGWVVVACDLQATPKVYNEVGEKSGLSQINGHLAIANIVKAYYLHGRQTTTGTIDGDLTTFESTIRQKEAEAFEVVICCEDEIFDPNDKIKTYIGTGIVTGASKRLKDNNHTITVEY